MPVALFLILAATLYRILPPLLHVHHDWMDNFSPLASLVLCGAVFFPKRMAAWVPFLILVVSDFILNHFAYHFPMLSWDIIPRYLIFALIGASAFIYRFSLRNKPFVLLSTAFTGSLLYYLATNTASWVGEVGYAKNLAGWWQALTVGLPGYEPTILFFRNSVISDLIFTSLFIVSMAVTSKKEVAISSPVVAIH